MLTEIYSTISKPFNTPMSPAEIGLWVLIYAVVAFAFYDVMRIITSFLSHAVEG